MMNHEKSSGPTLFGGLFWIAVLTSPLWVTVGLAVWERMKQ